LFDQTSSCGKAHFSISSEDQETIIDDILVNLLDTTLSYCKAYFLILEGNNTPFQNTSVCSAKHRKPWTLCSTTSHYCSWEIIAMMGLDPMLTK
jgi:hypothetical protein